MKNKKFIQKKGQSLFEVVFALGLASVILVAIIALATNSVRDSTFSKNSTVATQLSGQATEWLRSERDKGWAEFVVRGSSTGFTWCLSTDTWPSTSGPCGAQVTGTAYTRFVVLKTVDISPSPSGDGIVDTIDAEITVQWSDAQGLHDIKNQARFTDWRK